ncbi:TIGR01777 family oxidoreductase [Rarobacter incanus]|uniref:TIGR01777 family protein n=1 Tax=Rarobacter incanus TaxID=153494 RepID=A0A542SMJ4_9MICO|nr:TIGR01777 family oxidoreductase [Rarobacter incanus]TQK75850.1 hypothetical protein FB389_0489 [Rarobacter incanus]
MATILIAGGSGFIGSALTRALRERGDRAIILTRAPRGFADQRAWDPARAELDASVLDGVDAVVNLAGAGIADRRWTAARKTELIASRVGPTDLLSRAIAAHQGVGVLVQGSAIGYYGDRPGETLTEESGPGKGFIADLVRSWEGAAAPARDSGIPVAFLRTGIVLAPRGGALARLLPLIRLGLGGPLAGGQAHWGWITLRDHVRAIMHVLDQGTDGPVNIVAPTPATNGEVIGALAHAFNRPAWLRVPAPALHLVIGEFAGEILADQLTLPRVLLAAGFPFRDPTPQAAAKWIARSAPR